MRRGVAYCNAVAIPLPSLGVSSLDLGRLQPRAAPFFALPENASLQNGWPRSLGRGGAVGPQVFERNLAEPAGQEFHVCRDPGEALSPLVAPFVHVKRAIDLELDGVQPRGRIAVVLGDEAAGIGLVAADRVALLAQGLLHHVGDDVDATGAVAVAEHEFGACTFVPMSGIRRHGMTVDQHGGAEFAVQAGEQAAQCAVIGLVQALDARQRVVDRNAVIVDFLRVAVDMEVLARRLGELPLEELRPYRAAAE